MGDLRIKKPGKKTGFVALLNIPLYHTHVQFYPTTADAKLDINNLEDVVGDGYGAVTFIAGADEGNWINIVFKEPRYMTPEVIAHESTHAAWFVLHMAGVKVTFANHEQLAYLVGYFAEQLHLFVEAYNKYLKEQEVKS